MDEIKAKQQVVQKIKDAQKILVTVSDSPSVDALSAAIGLTMLLDKQEKYATAIFSGETPPAIAFLEPEKTFDDTTDSLRDFIIALNKEKADHLRYKVEGDSVKIFITPYKTTIDESDLEFSQGDYNVELVIALGVDDQDHLDTALDNHGQVLHDATIITMTNGDTTSSLGGIDWHDAQASSLSEMVTGLAEAMKTDKKKSLIDETIATALLTGVVAETDRFSNEHTTSKAMSVASQLMTAGADQQLIATELQQSDGFTASESQSSEPSEPEDSSDEASSTDKSTNKTENDASLLSISHEGESLADLDRRVRGDDKAKARVIEEVEQVEQEEASKEALDPNSPIHDTKMNAYTSAGDEEEPTLGGTLNATTEQAAEDSRREALGDQNHTILSHAYIGDPEAEAHQPSNDTPAGFPGTPQMAPGSQGVNDVGGDDGLHAAYAFDDTALTHEDTEAMPAPPSESEPTGGERIIQPLPDDVNAVKPPVFDVSASQTNPTPADLGLPLPPPLPDFSQPAPAAPPQALPIPNAPEPEILGDILAPETSEQPPAAPAPAPAPEAVAPFDPFAAQNAALGQTQPEMPQPELPPVAPSVPDPAQGLPPVAPLPDVPPAPQQPGDPGQFQIPPQQ